MNTSVGLTRLIVTPEIAAEWLSQKNSRNRHIAKPAVACYAKDMAEGRWDERFIEPIRFGVSGHLLDGQHRLAAVVESGRPIHFWIETGVPDESQMVMDTGRKRTLDQFERIQNPGRNISKAHTSTALAMIAGWGPPKRLSHAEQHQFLDTHYDAIKFAVASFRSDLRLINRAPVRAVVARAYYNAQHSEIREFTSILNSEPPPHPEPWHVTALTLQKWLLRNPGAGQAATSRGYLFTQKALREFLDHQPVSILRPASHPVELFPLPEEVRE